MPIALLIQGVDVVLAGTTIKGSIVIPHLRFEWKFDQIISRLDVRKEQTIKVKSAFSQINRELDQTEHLVNYLLNFSIDLV